MRRAWTAVLDETAAPGIGLVVTGDSKESPVAGWLSEAELAVTIPFDSLLAPGIAGAAVGTASGGTGEGGAMGLPREAVSADGCWFELRRNRAHRARTRTQMAALVNVLVQFRAEGATTVACDSIGEAIGSPAITGDSWAAGY